jgi:hypothetical protein
MTFDAVELTDALTQLIQPLRLNTRAASSVPRAQ